MILYFRDDVDDDQFMESYFQSLQSHGFGKFTQKHKNKINVQWFCERYVKMKSNVVASL